MLVRCLGRGFEIGGESASSLSRREARDWRECAREVLANSWSFTLNWPKEVREAVFDLKGGERQLLTRLNSSYLLCRSSSCTRSSPSPASAPPSGAGSRRATPPCPSPSQTRCVGNGYSCIRLGTPRIGENMEKSFCPC